MPYSDKEYKVSNVNYLNKDFSGFKQSLMNYAKTYFPTSYRDFNETSPGMMLIEMSAYVGDVLSFYIDQQYREMMLPLSEERRNVINLAKTLGYKTQAIFPAFVELTFKQTISSDTTDVNNIVPNHNQGVVIDKGAQVTATSDSNIIFETLDIVDFRTTGSYGSDSVVQSGFDATSGLVNEYTITRKVKAVSGETKTKQFTIGTPTKFKKLTLPETNVIEVVSMTDSNGNKWYEVDYLAQEQVAIATHYTSDNRDNAFSLIDNTPQNILPIPYSLEYIRTNKRFITELNTDNTTSIVFGNGILRSGQELSDGFLQVEQVGINVPGNPQDLQTSIDPLLGDEYSTLGETPTHTILTVKYRVGGGVTTNVNSGDLTTVSSPTYIDGTDIGSNTLTVTNEIPAAGGAPYETVDEIRHRAMAHFTTQRRCVTKEDYEARIMAMPAQFGNIAKVYVKRESLDNIFEQYMSSGDNIFEQNMSSGETMVEWIYPNLEISEETVPSHIIAIMEWSLEGGGQPFTDSATYIPNQGWVGSLVSEGLQTGHHYVFVSTEGFTWNLPTNIYMGEIPTIAIYIISYDKNRKFVGETYNANGTSIQNIPTLLEKNLKEYLNQYRLITDAVSIYQGKIINFGVAFEAVAHKHANNQDVKLRCIQKIIDYFRVEKMQFKQLIYTTELEYELMGVDGVRGINYVELTQKVLSDNTEIFTKPLWSMLYSNGSFIPSVNGTTGYGYQYNFNQFYTEHNGIIYPSEEPSVFELKNPKENIKGRVV